MNLQIFENAEFGKVRVVEVVGGMKYLVIGNEKIDKFKLLALASKISLQDKTAAQQVLELASILHHPENDFVFNELYGNVAMEITRNSIITEEYLYSRFNKSVKKIFGNDAKIVKKKNNPRHIPDSWIIANNNLMPVEMKLRTFDKKALKQLQRYMDFYECAYGVAVAEKTNVELPKNIKFVFIDELEV